MFVFGKEIFCCDQLFKIKAFFTFCSIAFVLFRYSFSAFRTSFWRQVFKEFQDVYKHCKLPSPSICYTTVYL